jgi:hypothetical protein
LLDNRILPSLSSRKVGAVDPADDERMHLAVAAQNQ